MTRDQDIGAGFRDPAGASRAVFRLALTALSRPARFWPADLGPLFGAAPPIDAVLAGLLLTLTDRRTPVWLSPSLSAGAGWLLFHGGTPVVFDPAEAHFVAAASLEELPPLSTLARGLERFPDRSATIIAGVTPGASVEAVIAQGPGLKEPTGAGTLGLSAVFIDQWADNHARYPLGVDALLAGPGSLAGLPRSTSLTRGPFQPPKGR